LLTEEDFFQIGAAGLLALGKDVDEGLAVRVLNRRMVDALRDVNVFSRKEIQEYKKEGRVILPRKFVDVNEYPIRDSSQGPLEILERKDIVKKILEPLDERETGIVNNLLKGYTQKEIREELGVTESRVSQLVKGIVKKGGNMGRKKKGMWNSDFWEVLNALKLLKPSELASAGAITANTKLSKKKVAVCLESLCKCIPDHVGKEGDPPLYSFRHPIGSTLEDLYQRLRDYYKPGPVKVSAEPAQTKEPTFWMAPEIEEAEPSISIAMNDLNKIRQHAIQILNPIVAFRFDQLELYQLVIKEQQRQAEEILTMLSRLPLT
jgi:RNA polymerase sigma factor (sigma-70 family)